MGGSADGFRGQWHEEPLANARPIPVNYLPTQPCKEPHYREKLGIWNNE